VKTWLRLALLLSSMLFLTAGIASADSFITYQFTGGGITASFEVPVNPTVVSFTPGFDFVVMPVDLMINGASSSDFVNFYNAVAGGGFVVTDGGTTAVINTAGPQLYSGSEGSPTMLGTVAGGVPLTGSMPGLPGGTLSTPGTVGPVGGVTSTPEPSVTVLLGVGLLAIGMAVLRFKPNFGVSAS
jgi:hypothetical protein